MEIVLAVALVAISFGVMISAYLVSNRDIKFMLAAAFVVSAIVVYKRNAHPDISVLTAAERSFFFRRLLLAELTPQAILFLGSCTGSDQPARGYSLRRCRSCGIPCLCICRKMVCFVRFGVCKHTSEEACG